jgi:hypothetical protein
MRPAMYRDDGLLAGFDSMRQPIGDFKKSIYRFHESSMARRRRNVHQPFGQVERSG